MPRFVYAKVYCDLLRHPLLLGRPDSDKVLVLGLILHAKEHSPDGLLRGIDAAEAKRICGTKASVKVVAAGLAYLVAAGWLIKEKGELRIRDFAERQKADGAAERMANWRNAHRNDAVTQRNGNVTSASTPAFPDVEVDVEEEKKEISTQRHEDPSAAPSESPIFSSLSSEQNQKKTRAEAEAWLAAGEPVAGILACSDALVPAETKAKATELFRAGKGTEAIALLAKGRS